MNFRRAVLFSFFVLYCASGFAQKKPLQDFPGAKDPALFTRMPGYFLANRFGTKEAQFDFYEFFVGDARPPKKERVEGHKYQYQYTFDSSTGNPPASQLQIKRNYQNAAKAAGGKVVFEGTDGSQKTTMVVAKSGKETWAEVWGNGGTYYLTIVEREAMKQDVLANADALKSGLAETGHVEVPGIFFEFNKADIKPESQPSIAEIAKLLKSEAALKVWVVGHTDNVGTAEFNVNLSNQRAAAVVKALVAAGIEPKRMTPHGNGPFAPVASNATEDGKAKNRRVELVAQQ